MIDASHCKVHPPTAGAKGDYQGMIRTKFKGLTTKALSKNNLNNLV